MFLAAVLFSHVCFNMAVRTGTARKKCMPATGTTPQRQAFEMGQQYPVVKLGFASPCPPFYFMLSCCVSPNAQAAFHRATRPILGPCEDLVEELRHLDACRSGEARSCKAYGLPCQRLLLTVGPKYKESEMNELSIMKPFEGLFKFSKQT